MQANRGHPGRFFGKSAQWLPAPAPAEIRDKGATPESLTAAVTKAAQAQGVLRETHLRYHLRMMEVLSAEQVVAYNKLRGY